MRNTLLRGGPSSGSSSPVFITDGLRQHLLYQTTPTVSGLIVDEVSGKASHRAVGANCKLFDGTNDAVELIDTTQYSFTGDFAVFAWVWLNTPVVRTTIASRWKSPSGWQAYIDAGRIPTIQKNGATTGATSLTVPSEEWAFVGIIANGTDAIYWVGDESSQSSETVGGISASSAAGTGAPKIGAYGPTGTFNSPFNGYLFDVRVFEHGSFTSDNVTWLRTFGQSGTEPTTNLRTHHKLSGTNPWRSYDSSGNGKHGNNVNTTAATFLTTRSDLPWSHDDEGGHSRYWDLVGSMVMVTDRVDYRDSVTVTFDIKTTDTAGIIFGNNSASTPWGFAWQDGSALTSLQAGMGITTITIGGVDYEDGTDTRDDVHTAIATGDWVSVSMSGVDFTSFSNGVYLNGYDNASFQFDGQIRNLTIGGDSYDGFVIPRNESTTTDDVLGETLNRSGVAMIPGQAVESACITSTTGNDYVELPFAAVASSSYEISIWFKCTTTAGANTWFIFDARDSSSDGITLNVNASGSGILQMKHNTTSILTTREFDDSVWYKAILSWDGATVTFDVEDADGILLERNTASDATTIATLTNMKVGNRSFVPQAGRGFPGQFMGLSLDFDGTQRLYPMSEQGRETAYEVISGTQHATLTGMTVTPQAGAWANTQDVYHYNIAYGCEVYDDNATSALFVYVPYQTDGTRLTPTISSYGKLGNRDAGALIASETQLDRTGGVVVAASSTWATSLEAGDTSTNPEFHRDRQQGGADVGIDRVVAYRETLSGANLSTTQTYTSDEDL